jgi:hypothetical protein
MNNIKLDNNIFGHSKAERDAGILMNTGKK